MKKRTLVITVRVLKDKNGECLMLPGSIEVQVVGPNGIAFPNLDALRRLRELGFKRKGVGRIGTARRSRIQQEFLSRYEQIRDLEHYRSLIGDERSQGPLVWFNPGKKLLMERTEHPRSKKPWYVVLDTAIGSREEFLMDLLSEKSITIHEAA